MGLVKLTLLALAAIGAAASPTSHASFLQASASASRPNASAIAARKKWRESKKHLRKVDPSAALAEANETLDTVVSMIEDANSSAVELLAQLVDAANAAIATLDTIKGNSGLLPGDLSTKVSKACDDLTKLLEKAVGQADSAQSEVNKITEKLLTEIKSIVDKLLIKLQAALDKVDAATTADPAALLAVAHKSKSKARWSPLGWLFGGGSKYAKARAAITQYNKTVAKLDMVLDSINATAVDMLMDSALGQAKTALTDLQVKAELPLSQIPAPLDSQAKSLLKTALSVVDKVSSKADTAEAAIETQIAAAKSHIPDLYAAADAMESLVDAAEEAEANTAK